MSTVSIAFYTLEIVASLSAVGILLIRNVFYASLLLITCLLSIAAIFILANAEFLAVTQILIYAGGVVVLIIFGVMLTTRISGKPLVVKNQSWLPGSLAGLFFLGLFLKLFSEAEFIHSTATGNSSYNEINQIGILLMTDYVIVFELAGVLLLTALIGAAVVASSFNTIKKTD